MTNAEKELNAWRELGEEMGRVVILMPTEVFQDWFPDWFGPRLFDLQVAGASDGAVKEPDTGWLVELGSSPPQWWTGRLKNAAVFTTDASLAMRFARREDAEGAIGHLVKDGTADGCKAVEHMWSRYESK